MTGEPHAGGVEAANRRELAAFPSPGGLCARNLGTGETIALDADRDAKTAGTIEVPVLIELFRRVETGEIDPEATLPADEAAHAPGSGMLRDLSAGVELSVRDHATLTIVVSDNTSTNVLIDLLGIDSINATMADFGFLRTRPKQRLDFPAIGPDARNLAVTTPAELAGIMAALADGTILSDDSRAAVLDIRRRQHYRNPIPRYLPFSPYAEELREADNGRRIANKTGGWTGLRANMALVEWPGTRDVLAVVTGGDPDTRFWAESTGAKVIGRLSRLVFDHWGGAALADAVTPAAPTVR